MAQTLKFGNGTWANKEGSTLAYNDENGNYKPLPFNFTRASSATRVNKQGLIEVVSNNKPRVDYSETSNGALILEPSRTNLFLYNEQFDNAWYTKYNVSVDADSTTSPSGSVVADSLIEDTANSTHIIGRLVSFTSGTSYSFSIFAKNNGRNLKISAGNTATWSADAIFDLENGIILSNSLGVAKIENYGNGWYRCCVTGSALATASTNVNIYLIQETSTTTYTGNGASGAYIWGSQFEVGSYATSLINTLGTAVTRVAEVANSCGNREVFNDSEGVLYANIAALANDQTNRRITISDGTNNNRIVTGYNTNSNYIFYFVVDGGSTVATGGYQLTDIKDYHKLAVKWKENDFALWIDGIEVHTDNSGTTPSGLDSLQFEQGSGGALYFYGKTKEIGYYTTLTDTEIEYLTSYRSWEEMVNELNLNIIYNG